MSCRREFLRGLAAAVLAPGIGPGALPMQDSLAGRGALGSLRDPSAVGRLRLPTDPRENEADVQAIEQRLACNCGCTLDVFTCRTTDFSCTYSPALHREVLALRDSGKTAQEILDAFVAKYGEKALMAPRPAGFNWVGYLLPGAAIVAAGIGLVAVISRRRVALAPGTRTVNPEAAMPGPSATPEELERLRRELSEVED